MIHNIDEKFVHTLMNENSLMIKQKKELFELMDIETRNKYSIETLDGKPVAFAAEESKGLGGTILRQLFGHWRSFDIIIFDQMKTPIYRAQHPFRFLFSTLIVCRANGDLIGTIQKRFSFLHKKFDIFDSSGNLIMEIKAPLWKPWTFPLFKNDTEIAVIQKKWSGILKEGFTDADNFAVNFHSKNLKQIERELILSATLLIDLVYFETKD